MAQQVLRLIGGHQHIPRTVTQLEHRHQASY
jgi:hypothetical protein